MRDTYVDYDTGAQVDLSKGLYLNDEYWTINRIVVPERNRGQGAGRKILKRVLAEADAEKVTLVLEINPYGPLNYQALENWYKRNGFSWLRADTKVDTLMIRRPQPRLHIHMWFTSRDQKTSSCRCGAEIQL